MDSMAGGRVVVGRLLPVLCSMVASCAHTEPLSPTWASPPPPQPTIAVSPSLAAREPVQVGYATWYGARFAGRMTSNGERFDPNRMTAAHRVLPFGTWVEVRRVDTGESVRVRITDRGPFGHEDRIIDVSRAAAQKLGIVKVGLTRVELRVVDGP
jgi:peptidoglycan lytic transglycosylase